MAARFHPLVVSQVDRLTDDAVAVTLDVPADLRDEFAFRPGQFLTVRRAAERRSYSICAPLGARPRIGVRKIEGGQLSTWLVDDLRPGDVIDVLPPAGSFTCDPSQPGRHVLIGAGSGITPLLSIASSLLDANDATDVTLLYGNRRAATVMFLDELADLKDRYPQRLQLIHVLSREAQEVELFNGRLDATKLAELLTDVVGVDDVHHWWLCGPIGLVDDVISVLGSCGVEAGRVHRELFYVGDEPPVVATHAEAPEGPGATIAITLDGRTSSVTVPFDQPVLDAAQRARPDLPFACKGGVCGTCRALVTSGAVRMRRNYALEAAEVEAGYVLTCQALPTTEAASVDYDA